ncbi:hypothetical protein HanRHA438_Chr17g0809291 [Helianthus annuus]|nr:hypothetical protein HanIR_Chr17g0866701 [Helianthus annuus]KAJ0825994.1 hypothetical protein HanRHA438_Chr17g0809291 [Helianthus annuus]
MSKMLSYMVTLQRRSTKQPQSFVDPKPFDHVFFITQVFIWSKTSPTSMVPVSFRSPSNFVIYGLKEDPVLFTYKSRNTLLYILVYFDDIIEYFDLKDLGTLDYVLRN